MGYPMTWQRFVRRNNLVYGDYNEAPLQWRPLTNVSKEIDPRAKDMILEARAERLVALEKQAALLAGDLRRLENDSRDEGAICARISDRVPLSRDLIAAVLKEFFSL